MSGRCARGCCFGGRHGPSQRGDEQATVVGSRKERSPDEGTCVRMDCVQVVLPLDLSLDVKTVRYDTLKVAKRLEAELGEEQTSFIEGDPSEWDHLPLPDGSFKVGIDGGYVRHWLDKKHNFEVIVGKSI